MHGVGRLNPRLSPYSHCTTRCLQLLRQYQHRLLDLVGHLAVLVSVALVVLCSFRKVPKAFHESSLSPRTQEGDSTLPENSPKYNDCFLSEHDTVEMA